MAGRRRRILTWHEHGNYLLYLTQVPHDFHVVTQPGGGPGRTGLGGALPWGPNVHEVDARAVRDHEFDLVLYQSRPAWDGDRWSVLSDAQRRLPRAYIEHDPPQQHPTDTRHWVDDPGTLLVHVTPFNELMWDSGSTPTTVIEHGVMLLGDSGVEPRERQALARGISVVNNLDRRGRRLGLDVYRRMAAQLPLDLVGLGADRIGGLGEVRNVELPAFMARYRFFFNPIRYTSLGLAIVEAMMAGLPIVGLATTELVTVIRNGDNGHVDTRLEPLAETMQRLLADPAEAHRLGDNARRSALARFGIERFVRDWQELIRRLCD
jgi:Glycosyl transferases group 1